MKLTERKVSDVLVLEFHGRIHKIRVGLFRHISPTDLIEARARSGEAKILLNLEDAVPRHCEFCTGTELAECFRRAAEQGALLKFFRGENSGIDLSIDICTEFISKPRAHELADFKTEAEAIASFGDTEASKRAGSSNETD